LAAASRQDNTSVQRQKPSKPDTFDGMIGPGQLLAWVGSSCHWLADLPVVPGRPAEVAGGPDGWRQVLASGRNLIGAPPTPAAREDYFVLCLAAHHATVGSYVPTDVDTKIRKALWRKISGPALARRWHLATTARGWSTTTVSTRVETTAQGPVSGHDGEWLSVAVAALGAALSAHDQPMATEIRAWIHVELEREAVAYRAAEAAARKSVAAALHLARLAWILTHNAGDVDQGLLSWPEHSDLAADRMQLAELAHLDGSRFAGVYHRAKAVYQVIAAEGHRNYPLRAVKELRRAPELLLPLGPCLEAWGRTIATTPLLTANERADVLAALLHGITAVRGQIGYHRAVVGMGTAPGGLATLTKRLPVKALHALDDLTVRAQLKKDEATFAAELAGRIRAAQL
jgi:hypothetical protein